MIVGAVRWPGSVDQSGPFGHAGSRESSSFVSSDQRYVPLAIVGVEKQRITLLVNGERHDLLAPVHHTLLEVLREELDLTGTKHGCELGECGACAVLVDGEPVLSCLTLPIEVQGREITTVEGLAIGGRPHALQLAFAELGAAQCGYCTPGFLVTARALLDGNPSPSRAEIAEALSGNLCRCTGYVKIFEAVELAAERIRGEETAR
jgi:aerobic-type carbon monoxide dehydrogenase small subunit (CoxS/CutS family)